jgi:hypothetical protein
MPLSRRLLPLTVLAIAMTSTSLPAMAQQGNGSRAERTPPPAEPARPQQSDTLSDAVRRIERSNRGQVLSAERMQFDGRDVNRIKVVDDAGRVRVYMDDAQSGSEPRRPPGRNDDAPRRRNSDD